MAQTDGVTWTETPREHGRHLTAKADGYYLSVTDYGSGTQATVLGYARGRTLVMVGPWHTDPDSYVTAQREAMGMAADLAALGISATREDDVAGEAVAS